MDKGSISPEMQAWFNIRKSIIATFNFIILKKKAHNIKQSGCIKDISFNS